MESVGIIGFGRFGKVLANILKKGYQVKVFDPNINKTLNYQDHSNTGLGMGEDFGPIAIVDRATVLKEKVIFIAVPIRFFEDVIKDITPSLKDHQTIIDVCSVKIHPTKIMNHYLPTGVGIISTHPLFGPDSYLFNQQIKMVMHLERIAATEQQLTNENTNQYLGWKDFFTKQGIIVIEMSPEKHDRLAAETQGLSHYLGRFLKEYGIKKTLIDTHGFTDLLHLVEQTCNDTWELFIDLQSFNPFTNDMIDKVNHSINILNQKAKLEVQSKSQK